MHSSSYEIMVHELGHSFANLADEYWAGDMYAREKANMTQETDPAKVKWKNWIGVNGVGIYQHCCGGNSALWVRPHNDCKMRYLGRDFCPVCKETIAQAILQKFGNPIHSSRPDQVVVHLCSEPVTFEVSLVKPTPNTLRAKWILNGVDIAMNAESFTLYPDQLNTGGNILSVQVLDTTSLIRAVTHPTSHTHNVNWTVIKDLLPEPAQLITGPYYVCQGQNSVTYTVPAIANATSYIWTLPTGISGSSATNSITVNFDALFVYGNINVKGANDCGVGLATEIGIWADPLPKSAGLIAGPYNVCQGQNSVTYSVPVIANATSYIWTLTEGLSGSSTTNSITVNFDSSAVLYENIGIKGANACGNGLATLMSINVHPLPEPAGLITGPCTVCAGQNSVTFEVPAIADATSYIWTMPAGASGSSTTNSITVNFDASAVSGNIGVKGANDCGTGRVSEIAITVNPLTEPAGLITGPATVCQGQNSVTYEVPPIANAASYIWTLPDGASGTSSTNSITVYYDTSAVSGTITAKGTNDCGDGEASVLAITVNLLPEGAGTIAGPATVCQGQNSVTYEVPSIANAVSYIWTLPDGASGTSTANSITVDYDTSAVSGAITVQGTNDCGFGTTSDLAVTVNDLPATPFIMLNGNILHSDAAAGNQWYDQNGLIKGATDQDYAVTASGDYYAIVTLAGCSSDTSNILNVNLTEIEITEKKYTIRVYPNPVTHELIIETEANEEMLTFEILNALGQVVFNGHFVKNTTVPTDFFTPGIYLIKIDNGKTFEFTKIVKE